MRISAAAGAPHSRYRHCQLARHRLVILRWRLSVFLASLFPRVARAILGHSVDVVAAPLAIVVPAAGVQAATMS